MFCVAGFKFQEVEFVILQGLFEIVILAETKSDRPPNLPKSVWESQLANMMLRAGRFTAIILVGDLNCDLLNTDSGAKNGSALIDLAEVYRLSNLIKEPTRITNTSTTRLTLYLHQNRKQDERRNKTKTKQDLIVEKETDLQIYKK